MSRFIVQFESPDARAEFFDKHGMMTKTNKFLIKLGGKKFRPVHDLALFPVVILEALGSSDDGTDGTAFFSGVDGIKAWEPDVEFFLSGLSASTILNTNYINTSIYGPFHGDNIPIAIIDGGIDVTQPDLASNMLSQNTFLRKTKESSSSGREDLGHGTAIAGIICGSGSSSGGKYTGIVNGVKIIDCQAFDGSGKGLLSDVLAAVENAATCEAKLICMPFSSVPGAKPSAIFENLLLHLSSVLDIVLCAGTGNNGPEESTIGMPGCFDCVLTTGSLTPNFKVSLFSGRGNANLSKPDFCLPGEDIISLNVEASTFRDNVLDENEYYAIFSGNSMSVAFLAGIVAMILAAEPALKPAQIKQLFRASSIRISGFSKISAGNGILNVSIALRRLSKLYAFQKAYMALSKEIFMLASIVLFFTVAVSMMLASFI
jgi:serine protease AprX